MNQLGVYVGPVDRSLTRTGWWLVPLHYDRLVSWYAAHAPANVASTYPPHSTASAAQAEFDWPTHTSSPAYSTPIDVVEYAQLGPAETVIRADVTLAARADRTAPTVAPSTVTSIDITKQAIDGPDTSPYTARVSDHHRILAVVAAFNGLSGAFLSQSPHTCGSPVGIEYAYSVSFQWPGHTLNVSAGQVLCGEGRALTLDGVNLPQTLQDSDQFDNALETALGH